MRIITIGIKLVFVWFTLLASACTDEVCTDNNANVTIHIEEAVSEKGLQPWRVEGPCEVGPLGCTDDASTDCGYGYGVLPTDVGICELTLLFVDGTEAFSKSIEFGYPPGCCKYYEPCPLLPRDERVIHVTQ